MRFWPLFVLCVLAAPLHARSPGVAIESAVFIERKGSTDLTIEPAQDFRRGERVVTVMRWDAPAGNFTITSPVPRALQFERGQIRVEDQRCQQMRLRRNHLDEFLPAVSGQQSNSKELCRSAEGIPPQLPSRAEVADGEGFEPSVPFWSTHAFQASPFDHSGTHPFRDARQVAGVQDG